MADILEVFFIKFVGEDVLCQHHVLPWPDKSISPNLLVDSFWADMFNRTPKAIHRRCIRHSSSWRWRRGVDTKTYFVYSEEFDFTAKNSTRLALDRLKLMRRNVLAHAVMHLALLVQQRDYRGIYTRKLKPMTIAKLKQLPPAPAGKLD